MKLHEHSSSQLNLIARYGNGQLSIAGQSIGTPCIVAPGLLHATWIPDIAALTLESLDPLWSLQPQIVLLGTAGSASAPVTREFRSGFASRLIALEIMNLGAACRTYNVLAQEDRSVAALLFPQEFPVAAGGPGGLD
jgi:uncharacterized protein